MSPFASACCGSLAAIAALPLAFVLQRGVLNLMKRLGADVDSVLPLTIRMLLAGMVLGKAASWMLGPMFPFFKLGTELFRDSLITIAIFLTAVLINEGLGKIQAYHAGRLMLATTVGATGMTLGAILSMGLAYVFWNGHPAINQNAHWQAWTQLVDWVAVVTNGWIGDSSTQVPIMLTLENSASSRRPMLCATGNLGMAPAFLLDWAVTLPWFIVALKVARPSSPKSAAPESASHPGETPNCSPLAKLGIVACGLSGGIAMCFLAHHPDYRSSFLRPLFVIVLYSIVAALGMLVGRRGWIRAKKSWRSLALAGGVGGFGIIAGIGTSLVALTMYSHTFMLLLACGFGALVCHCLFLWLIAGRMFGYNRHLLAVASMCCVGGLATAPEVAGAYSHDAIDSAYLCALWTNVLSLPLTFLLWIMF
jgi:hypothetical protein